METVYTKSYDAKGRVVGISEKHFVNGEETGHCAQYVDSEGYWSGGFYDAQIGFGGQLARRKFVEGEILPVCVDTLPPVLHFGTTHIYLCSHNHLRNACMGVIIFIVICLSAISYMCGGNQKWGE